MENQLPGVDGLAQSGIDFEPCDGALAHAFIEHGKTRLTAGFGVVHGRVRVAQQVFGCVARGTHGDPYTDAGKYLTSIQTKRGFELIEYALRDHGGIGRITDVTKKNGEFVTAEAGDNGLPVFPSGADARAQSPGNP